MSRYFEDTKIEDVRKRYNNWDDVFNGLNREIELRDYSKFTLKAYWGWLRRFRAFTKINDYKLLDQQDAIDFLNNIVIKRSDCSASQNQAFSAIIFLYKFILKKDCNEIEKECRLKRDISAPVILSREEIELILDYIEDPVNLVVRLLYGCGLRIAECLNLRVRNFDFDSGMLLVNNNKGENVRTVPIPNSLVNQLKLQIDRIGSLYNEDIENNFDGAFLPHGFEGIHENKAVNFIWQWIFPQSSLTMVRDTMKLKRYHLHETSVQKKIKCAVDHIGIKKQATAQTFRHSFAVHLLERNYDIRTVQKLLGHSSVRTTMSFYRNVKKARTINDAISPLDF